MLSSELEQFSDRGLSLDSPYYIKRPSTEDKVFAELQKSGCIIRIQAPSYFGKTSLLNQLYSFAINHDYKSIYLNFQEADEKIFTDLNQFLRWFCINITTQLALSPNFDDYWDEGIGSKLNCTLYFEMYLFQQLDTPLVLLLDEVNRVFEHPNIALDFLPLLRAWHEQSKIVPTWQKLKIVVAHVTEINIPLNMNQSPFNVGLSIKLPPFTVAQVLELAAYYDFDWQNNLGMHNTMLLQSMLGGHPYLTHLTLYYLNRQKGEITLENFLKTALTENGIYRHYLQNYLLLLNSEPALKAALSQVVIANKNVQINPLAACKLEALGLIQLKDNLASISCELYRLYFQKQL